MTHGARVEHRHGRGRVRNEKRAATSQDAGVSNAGTGPCSRKNTHRHGLSGRDWLLGRGWGVTFSRLRALLGARCCGYQPSFASHAAGTQPHHSWTSTNPRSCRPQREVTSISTLLNIIPQQETSDNRLSQIPYHSRLQKRPHPEKSQLKHPQVLCKPTLALFRNTRLGTLQRVHRPAHRGRQGQLETPPSDVEGEAPTQTQWRDYGSQLACNVGSI